jgi:hypothetical protein
MSHDSSPRPYRIRWTAPTLFVVALCVAGLAAPGPLTGPAHAAPSWLDVMNQYRAQAGEAPVIENATLSANDAKHVAYMLATGTMNHFEDPASPYYTPEGDLAARNSNLTGGADPQAAIEGWMGAPFHALGLLRPTLSQSGFAAGSTPDGARAFSAVDVLSLRGYPPRTVWPRVWPAGALSGHLTRYHSEAPSPTVPCPPSTGGYGLPILASLGPGAAFTSVSATLDHEGVAVPVCVTSAATYPTVPGAVRILNESGTVLVIPLEPLKFVTRYTGTVTTDRGSAGIDFTVGRGTPRVELGFQATDIGTLPSLMSPLVITDNGRISVLLDVQWRKAGTAGWSELARVSSGVTVKVSFPAGVTGLVEVRGGQRHRVRRRAGANRGPRRPGFDGIGTDRGPWLGARDSDPPDRSAELPDVHDPAAAEAGVRAAGTVLPI